MSSLLNRISNLAVKGIMTVVLSENTTQNFTSWKNFGVTILNSRYHLISKRLIDRKTDVLAT